jgi:hypothetical protein
MLAHELGWPVSILKQLTTISEFEKWPTYFRKRRAQHEKEDWYMAAVAQTIAAVNGNKTKVEDHLLVFATPKKKDSRSTWLSMFGFVEPQE